MSYLQVDRKNELLTYVNVNIVNNETTDNQEDPVCSYSTSRDVAILDDASQYFFSIIKFQMNNIASSIPLFIPRIASGSINETVYKITIQYAYQYDGGGTTTVTKTLPITFVSQNKHIAQPTRADPGNSYYHVQTIQHMVKLINDTFSAVNTEVIDQIETDEADNTISNGNVPEAPYLDYSPTSELFTLYLDKLGYGKTGNAYGSTAGGVIDVQARLFFNTNLYHILSNFHSNYEGGDVKELNTLGITDASYEILPRDTDPLNLHSYTNSGTNYYKLSQDWSTLSNEWCPIESLAITSNSLPIKPETSSSPVFYTDDSSTSVATSRSIFTKLITDFSLAISSPFQYKQSLFFFGGNNELRYIEMTKSKQEIRNIDISIYMKLRRNGQLVPLRLPNSSSIHLKLLFKHKSLMKY